jgi:hypothetical protein
MSPRKSRGETATPPPNTRDPSGEGHQEDGIVETRDFNCPVGA